MPQTSTKQDSETVAQPQHPDKPAIWERFIASVEHGDTLKQATAKAGAAWSSIARWCSDTATLDSSGIPYAERYARARLTSAATFADLALDAARIAEPEDVQVRRLQVDVYKWRAAMANPKEYGDRKQVDTNVTVKMLPVEERDRALARLTAKATLANPMTVTTLATVEDANVQDLDTPL